MSEHPGITAVVASHSLRDLLTEARERLHSAAALHDTQRGGARSANGFALTWLAPQTIDYDDLTWKRGDVEWYLRVFVERTAENDPLRLAKEGDLVFPYTYAARTRYWDGGWASLATLLEAMRVHDLTPDALLRSQSAFRKALATLGERLHLQTALSLLLMYQPTTLERYLAHPEEITAQAATWRRDTLLDAIEDVAANPYSRRAVVPAISYPQLEGALVPQMGKPPYQLFQLLPDDATASIASIHEHRSLDVFGGAELDFAHDLSWLTLASQRLNRPVGDITVVAHNLHEYEDAETVDADPTNPARPIEQWLCRVTDGYRAGQGAPKRLLSEPSYAANLRRAYEQWRSAR